MSLILSSRTISVQEIPVLLTLFNRPEKTRAVIQNLAQIKPMRLFLAADGPRPDNFQDVEKCRLARQEAINIDWPCDIQTKFLDDNIGCDPAVSSAIGWFFKNVEYGIILEDDGIVHPHFFAFCGEILKRYYDDLRIMQISSLSPYGQREYPYDYHFSRTFRCSGGWATWRRAWEHYAVDISRYSDAEALAIMKAYHADHTKCMQQYKLFLAFKQGLFNFWDYKWNLACFAQNGLNIVPEKNLMINIGFDEEGTHTKQVNIVFKNLQIQPLKFPLRHPPFVYADSQPERSLSKQIYNSLSYKSRCLHVLRKLLGGFSYLREVMPFD